MWCLNKMRSRFQSARITWNCHAYTVPHVICVRYESTYFVCRHLPNCHAVLRDGSVLCLLHCYAIVAHELLICCSISEWCFYRKNINKCVVACLWKWNYCRKRIPPKMFHSENVLKTVVPYAHCRSNICQKLRLRRIGCAVVCGT